MIGTPTLIISHRGNLNGPNSCLENSFNDLKRILEYYGFGVEVDIWCMGSEFYTGHDEPKYHLSDSQFEYLLNSKDILFHAKNLEALEQLLIGKPHVFWHQRDDFTLSSRNFIITYPGQPLTYNSIVMHPERYTLTALKSVYAICTDYPIRWKEALCN